MTGATVGTVVVDVGHEHKWTQVAADTPVSAIMTRDVVSATRDMSAEVLTEVLLEKGLHGAPVLEGALIVGYISTTDLLRNRAENGDTKEMTRVRGYMHSGAVYDFGP